MRAMNAFYSALFSEECNQVLNCQMAKEIWDMLIITHDGTTCVKKVRINVLLHKYELFTMKKNETIRKIYSRLMGSIASLGNLGHKIDLKTNNQNMIRSLLSS